MTRRDRALDLVKTVSKGRLDCLVLNGDTGLEPPTPIDGALPLADVVRFDDRVRHFSEYIRDAYIVETADHALGVVGTTSAPGICRHAPVK